MATVSLNIIKMHKMLYKKPFGVTEIFRVKHKDSEVFVQITYVRACMHTCIEKLQKFNQVSVKF